MRSLRARLQAWIRGRTPKTTSCGVSIEPRILVLAEGPHDIEFLRRIGAILHVHDRRVPDLTAMERQGRLIFIPFGGGDVWIWTTRLAALNLPEFHLYDREDPPETEIRRQAANAVNLRPNCRAWVTGKRSLENYLHPEAIREVCGLEIRFTDDDPVADLLAQQLYERDALDVPWADLPRRTKTRRRNRVKKWLHSRGVERMTPQRLAQCDPDGEVRTWLKTIARMASGKP